MRIIHNNLLTPRHYDAINILGIVFCRKGMRLSAAMLRHEAIHTAQMKEMIYIFFYIWYVLEWLFRLPLHGSAYYNLSFEKEAYAHMYDSEYLKHRLHYAWWKYLRHRPEKPSQS